MFLLIRWYWGISLYKSKALFQSCKLKGGNIPDIISHLVIDNPESVNLVSPPTKIIINNISNNEDSQYTVSFWYSFFSKNNYIPYILFKLLFIIIYVAMKNQRIKKIRKKLDQLDDKMLNIIKKRSLLVDQILANKTKKNQIVDKKRIKVIFKNIRKKSLRRKIDPNISKNIWRSMIKAFINYEYKNFKKK